MLQQISVPETIRYPQFLTPYRKIHRLVTHVTIYCNNIFSKGYSNLWLTWMELRWHFIFCHYLEIPHHIGIFFPIRVQISLFSTLEHEWIWYNWVPLTCKNLQFCCEWDLIHLTCMNAWYFEWYDVVYISPHNLNGYKCN